MATTVVETPINTTDIDTQINDMQTSIALIQNQITELENENTKLLRDITSSSVEDAARYRLQYNSNKDGISQLKSELSTSQSRLKELQQARQEADEGESLYLLSSLGMAWIFMQIYNKIPQPRLLNKKRDKKEDYAR